MFTGHTSTHKIKYPAICGKYRNVSFCFVRISIGQTPAFQSLEYIWQYYTKQDYSFTHLSKFYKFRFRTLVWPESYGFKPAWEKLAINDLWDISHVINNSWVFDCPQDLQRCHISVFLALTLQLPVHINDKKLIYWMELVQKTMVHFERVFR